MPPPCAIAAMKEVRVRVEGFSNSISSVRPANRGSRRPAATSAFTCTARAISQAHSSAEKSEILRKCFIKKTHKNARARQKNGQPGTLGAKSVLLYQLQRPFYPNLTLLVMSSPSTAQAADAPSADSSADAEPNPVGFVLIHGETVSGGKFRPSDWCDRLHGTLRVLGDDAEETANYVHLVNYQGKKCVMIDNRLEDMHPKVFRFFLNFAANNKLVQQPISQQEWNTLRR